MVRLILAAILVGCLWFQVSRINPRPLYPTRGERAPFDLTQSGVTVSRLRSDCVTGFIVSPTCPFSHRLADSLPSLQGNESEPIWIVAGGREAAQAFSEEHSLPLRLVYTMAVRKRGWLSSPRVPTIPFTPLRIILDRDFIVMDLSQAQSIPSAEEREELCALDSG